MTRLLTFPYFWSIMVASVQNNEKVRFMLNNVKKQPRIPLSFILLLLGIDALAGILAVLRLADPGDFFILAISYLCQLLTLSAQFLGVGAALRFLASRQMKHSLLCLLLAALGHLLTLLIAGVTESFLYLDTVTVLIAQISSAIVNSALYFCFYVLLLLGAYFFCFRRLREPCLTPPPFFGKHPVTVTSCCFAAGIFVVELVFQIITTVEFVDTYWPSIYTNEIVSLVIDYIFILLSAVLAHFVACATAAWFTPETEE